MKVKVVESFHDIHGGELHRRGSFLEVTDERYHEIAKSGNYVVPVDDKSKDEQKKG